jgi:GGDEF domain-containing protein
VAPGLPIIGLPLGAVARELRLTWLRAGAWDVFGFPVDVEELLLKLDGYLRAADSARAGLLADPASGLYNARGLERRARELLAEAVRLHAALACVVFGPEVRSDPSAAAAGRAGPAAVRGRLGAVLRTHARLSDTVGWWNDGEFAVLAPATDAAGAVHLAERLAQAIETAPLVRGASGPALQVRVGYEAVADVHATPVEAPVLLAHATAALARARTDARGSRIERFQP